MKPLICFVGRSNSGKTTLVSSLVSFLTGMGLRVGTMKHAHKGFDLPDKKDSSVHKKAGARVSLVSSPGILNILMDTPSDLTPLELLRFMEDVDIVLVEGFKSQDLPKIELFTPSEPGELPICIKDPQLLALVTKEDVELKLPVFRPNQIGELAEFILNHLRLKVPGPQRVP